MDVNNLTLFGMLVQFINKLVCTVIKNVGCFPRKAFLNVYTQVYAESSDMELLKNGVSFSVSHL